MNPIRADARALPLIDGCVQCVVTSPPYWGLRDYGTATWAGGDPACDHSITRRGHQDEKQATSAGTSRDSLAGFSHCRACAAVRIDAQIGLEPTPAAYVAALVAVFREVWRVLRDNGTVWLNLGDSYATGAGAVGNCPGGGKQGEQWIGTDSRGYRGARLVNTNSGTIARPKTSAVGPMTQPNQMPIDGLKPKDLVGIPWRVAFALQADGWYLRSDIIWHKPNPMPESVTDRPTKAHEYVFLLAKSERYYYDAGAIAEDLSDITLKRFNGIPYRTTGRDGDTIARSIPNGKAQSCGARSDGRRNKRSVWTIPTMPYAGAHFATMPEALVKPCILAGCPIGGLVLDPFLGSGTVGAVAERLGRRWIGCDLTYQPLSRARTTQRGLQFDAPAEHTTLIGGIS